MRPKQVTQRRRNGNPRRVRTEAWAGPSLGIENYRGGMRFAFLPYVKSESIITTRDKNEGGVGDEHGATPRSDEWAARVRRGVAAVEPGGNALGDAGAQSDRPGRA